MRAAITTLLLATTGCAGARQPAPATTQPIGTVAAAESATLARLADGRHTVRTVCAACHTESPPPKAAPPFRMVAMHYRRSLGDSAAARIVAWVRAPAAERSLLPRHAVSRFGVMPPLQLPEAQLQNVAFYILSLAPDRMGRMLRDSRLETRSRH